MKAMNKQTKMETLQRQMEVETAKSLNRGMLDHRSIKIGHVVSSSKFSVPETCQELRPSNESSSQPMTKAKYVVIAKVMAGGGDNGYPGDSYPDGLHVVAQRLHEDGRLNPQGQVIVFRMSGCFCNVLSEVQLQGEMKLNQETYNIGGKAVVIFQQ